MKGCGFQIKLLVAKEKTDVVEGERSAVVCGASVFTRTQEEKEGHTRNVRKGALGGIEETLDQRYWDRSDAGRGWIRY